MMRTKITLTRGADTVAAATGSLRESLGFVLTSLEKQMEDGGLGEVAEKIQAGEAVEYVLRFEPGAKNG